MATNLEDPAVVERNLKRRFALLALEQRFPSLRKTPEVANRISLWKACVENVGANAMVTVLDFGVYQGRSTKFWATNFTNPDSRFHGFDSFEGLPHDWTSTMPKGTFSTQGQVPQINDTRVSFHQGWIQNTLPGFLESGTLSGRETLIAHVDTDIYSAALFVLTTLWHYFDRFFVVFDEFGVDENLALANFSEAYPVKIEFYCHTMSQYKMPAQVFGLVTKSEYK